MDTTLGEMKLKILRLLGDFQKDSVEEDDYGVPISGQTFDADLLKDGVHAALDALSTRFWKEAVADIALTDDETHVFSLPADLIDIEAVYDGTLGKTIPRLFLRAGEGIAASQTDNIWLDYPQGSITFVNSLGSSGAKIYYSATWAKPDIDDDNLEPPVFTSAAIAFYGASYCLLRAASSSASLRQYATRVDSGTPLDNPLKDMSDYFLKRYEHELKSIPQKMKGITN